METVENQADEFDFSLISNAVSPKVFESKVMRGKSYLSLGSMERNKV